MKYEIERRELLKRFSITENDEKVGNEKVLNPLFFPDYLLQQALDDSDGNTRVVNEDGG